MPVMQYCITRISIVGGDGVGVILAAIVPHPPVVVPGVASEGRAVGATFQAMTTLSRHIAALAPDTVIVITPHGPVGRDFIPVVVGERIAGDLSQYGVGQRYEFAVDNELANSFIEIARQRGLPVGAVAPDPELDHGVCVPAHFLTEAGVCGPVVIIGIGLVDRQTLLEVGRALADATDATGRRAVVLASGDLSHRLCKGAPAGYHPAGMKLDTEIRRLLLAGDSAGMAGIDYSLADAGGECGLRPILIMMGACPGRARELSYEGPFGVGYLVAAIRPEPVAVRVAREAIERAFNDHKDAGSPPPELAAPRAVFVSLKSDGELRGCIGTLEPSEDSAYEEIRAMALSAAFHDPRFAPVTESELDQLTISVDILDAPEPVDSIAELDPRTYGVIVQKGQRRGVLLPDLHGIDAAEDQVAIACQKAGIAPGSPGLRLRRFRVTRHQ